MNRELSSRHHKLIRMHNKAKRALLRAPANDKAVKARRVCAKSVWEYASQFLQYSIPSFGQAETERNFTRVYQIWVVAMPPCFIPYNEDRISIKEV